MAYVEHEDASLERHQMFKNQLQLMKYYPIAIRSHTQNILMARVRWIALPPATPDCPCESVLDQTATLIGAMKVSLFLILCVGFCSKSSLILHRDQ